MLNIFKSEARKRNELVELIKEQIELWHENEKIAKVLQYVDLLDRAGDNKSNGIGANITLTPHESTNNILIICPFCEYECRDYNELISHGISVHGQSVSEMQELVKMLK